MRGVPFQWRGPNEGGDDIAQEALRDLLPGELLPHRDEEIVESIAAITGVVAPYVVAVATGEEDVDDAVVAALVDDRLADGDLPHCCCALRAPPSRTRPLWEAL